MKKVIHAILLLSVIGMMYAPAQGDTSIHYAICRKNVKRIEIVPQGNLYSLGITLTDTATEDFFRLTEANVGKTIDILFDNSFLSGADIEAPIKSGYILSVPATKAEADRLKEKILDGSTESLCGRVK